MEKLPNPQTTADNVAANVRAMREERGWSLATLAERISEQGVPMSLNTVSKVEGRKRGVDVDDLVAIARAFGCPPERLLEPPPSAPVLQIQQALAEITTAREMWSDAKAEAARARSRVEVLSEGLVILYRYIVDMASDLDPNDPLTRGLAVELAMRGFEVPWADVVKDTPEAEVWRQRRLAESEREAMSITAVQAAYLHRAERGDRSIQVAG